MTADVTNIRLPYGGTEVSVSIPAANLMGVFRSRRVEIERPEEVLIAEALADPIGTPRLAELVRPGMKIAIVADDKTRATPVSKILPALLDELSLAGVPDQDVFVVFALGTHHRMTSEEMTARAGDAVARRIKLYNSEFSDPQGIADCGTASGGIRVTIDKRVAEADFRIAVGSIIPHPECGWSGGAKIIYPGTSSRQTVTAFHLSFAHVDWNPYGSADSPIRLNMEQWVDNVGLDFIVNCVVTSDDRIYRVVAGDYVKAHRQGVQYARDVYSAVLPQRADVVLITSFRAEEDFWLASKAIFAGELVVRDGGTLILLAACPDGIGPHPEYASYIGVDEVDPLVSKAFSGEVKEPIAVSAAVAIARMRRRFSIALVSDGLAAEEVARMKCEHFTEAGQAVEAALRRHGPQAKVAVLPDGISTVPTANT